MRLLAATFLILTATVASALPPNPATGLTATPIADGAIRLNWTASAVDGTHDAADGYRVQRALTSAPGVTTDLTVTTSLTYTDSSQDLVLGTSYTYTVTALNSDGAANAATATAVPSDPPGTPANLRVTKITGNSISLSWNAVSEAGVKYNVYREDEDDPVAEEISATTYTDSGLDATTEYIYWVTAVTDGGESGDSNEVTATTFGDGTEKQAAFAKRFRQIDVDASGLLSLDEYIAGHGARLSWVVVVNRFEYSDTDGSVDLSLAEYAKALGGRKYFAPSKPRQFYLADNAFEEGDGVLTKEEFALTLPARTGDKKVTKYFDKLNKDTSDGGLTPLEMKIRNYAPPLE